MLLILLFISILAMGALVYGKVNKDIFTPSLLILISYAVSVGCAVLNMERWNIELLPVTFAVLLIGAVEFVVIGAAIDHRYRRGAVLTQQKQEENTGEIKPEGWKQILTYLGCVVYCVLLYHQVMAIAQKAGEYESFSQALNLFKHATSVTMVYALPWWISQLERIVMICAYIYMYIFLHNVVRCRKEQLLAGIVKNSALLIPLLAYVVNGVLNSDRLMILQTMIGAIVMLFILWVYRTEKEHISVKTLLILAASACVGLLVFYWSAERIGRITDKGLFEYITYYCGCGIECLNQFFKAPPEASDIFGKETFYNLNLKLYDLGLLDLEEFYPIHLEFRYYKDIMLGNVYTAYRRWIYDFGILGAAVLQGIMAVVMSVLYNRVKYRRFKNTGFWLIVYAYLAYTVVFHPYDGYLYIQYVSQTGLTTFLLLRLIYWFYVEMKVTCRGGFSVILSRSWKIENGKLQRRQ